MRKEVARDLEKSLNDLRRVVIPTLVKHCPEFGRTDFRVIESPDNSRDELHRDLDVLAGIDAYQRWLSAMRGIASRVQIGENYRTFTIRLSRPSQAKTEYEKRLTAIKRRDEGFLYPYWTVQAYMTSVGGELQSVGLARTDQLYLYVEAREQNGHQFPRKRAGQGGETFLYVSWDEYKASGNYFYEYPDPALLKRIDAQISRVDQALALYGDDEEEAEEEEVYTLAEYEELFACERGMEEAEELLETRAWEELSKQAEHYPFSEMQEGANGIVELEQEQPSWFLPHSPIFGKRSNQ